MKNTELRIGNWIQYRENLLKVTSINETMICCDPTWGFDDFDSIEGVPLTNELLEKITFPPEYYLDRGGLYKMTGMGSSVWIARVEYLHQLQNLYCALTGQELTTTLLPK